jgi:hypothetical protein
MYCQIVFNIATKVDLPTGNKSYCIENIKLKLYRPVVTNLRGKETDPEYDRSGHVELGRFATS